MAIEFRCDHCGRMLRVADDTAGRQAQCPHCRGLTTVPEAVPPPGWSPPLHHEQINPFQSPSADPSLAPDALATPAGPLLRTPVKFEDIFRRTWTILQRNLGTCVVASLIVMGVSLAVNMPISLVLSAAGEAMRDPEAQIAMAIVSNLLTTAFGTWLEIGLAIFMLKIARGQPAAYGDIFSGLDYFVPIILAKLLFTICVWVAGVFCFLPGIVVAAMMFQYYYLIIDRGAGIIDSLKMSIELTNGSRLHWSLIFFVTWVGGIILIVLTCGLGLLLWWPFYMLLFAVGYLAMTGQPTSDRVYFGPTEPTVSPFQQ